MESSTVYRRDRSAFFLAINQIDNGYTIVMTPYIQECFCFHFQNFVDVSPTGWQITKNNYLSIWIPQDRVPYVDFDALLKWAQYAGCQCVWLDLNPYIESSFTGAEMDYCIAGDFNFVSSDEKLERTELGEAEYRLKYKSKLLTEEEGLDFLKKIIDELLEMACLLPINHSPLFVSSIPCEQGKENFSHILASTVQSYIKNTNMLHPTISISKPEVKLIGLEDKIAFWKNLYLDKRNVLVDYSLIDGSDILIIDDLYQSGATMWTYAEFLKRNGARHVYGLACVKTLSDRDNI